MASCQPASLQSVGEIILRPLEVVTQFAHLSPDDISHLHFPPSISHACAEMLACIRDKMTFRLMLYCGFVFIVCLSSKILFAFIFCFLPKIRSLGCDEIIMTFHFGYSASAKVFLAILPQSVRAMCNEIVTTFMIEKPTSQGMAKPCCWEVGSSN